MPINHAKFVKDTWLLCDTKADAERIASYLISRGDWFVYYPNREGLRIIIPRYINIDIIRHFLPSANFTVEP